MRFPLLKSSILTYSLLLNLFLISCSRKIIPERPDLGKSYFRMDTLPLSEIDIPLRINLKPYYELVNKNVQTIYHSPGWPNEFEVENCDTRYMYRFKRGPFSISSHGRTVNMNFIGSYIIAGAQRICSGTGSNRVPLTPWTPTCTCGVNEPEPRVYVGYKAEIDLLKDYRLAIQLDRQEPVPIDKCTVCFWKHDITPTVLDQLKVQLDEAGRDIRDSLSQLSLRPQFQQLWDKLNTGIPIEDLGYLQVHPEQLRLSTMFIQNDTLTLSFGISARPVISLTKPPYVRTVVPDISNFDTRKGFSIFVDAVMNYDSLGSLLTRTLYHHRIDMDKIKKHILIERCEVYGVNNERLIFKIDFSGSATGTLYLTGKPYFNRGKNQLQVRDIDYDVHTRAMLLKTAKWLFNRKIINTLNRYSVFDLSAYADTLINKLNEQMNRDWSSSITSTGEVSSMQVMGIYPFTENLIIRTNVNGELSLQMNGVLF